MTNQVVAQEILRQMGGIRRISMMTGAKDFVAGEDKVIFKIGKGAKNKINTIKIELNAMDLYDVTFMRVWGTTITTIKKVDGIYNDMLKSTFENETGFYLSF
jgi:hypothetical protein